MDCESAMIALVLCMDHKVALRRAVRASAVVHHKACLQRHAVQISCSNSH